MTSKINPPALRRGDTIGIASPASPFDKNSFSRGVRRIQEAGYKTLMLDGIFSRSGYLAGSDGRRADEIHSLFSDSRVRAIFCARGGYGSMRIIPLLDPGIIRAAPKIFMGYSDITSLHAFFNGACGLTTFHGPFVTEMGELGEESLGLVFRSLGNHRAWGELACGGLTVLRSGVGDGILTGGSLSVFSRTIGTPCEPDTDGAILFFEDRGEKPYAVDRIFFHLLQAGKFDSISGLILGHFIPPSGWSGGSAAYSGEVRRIVLDLLEKFRFPILADFPAGHSPRNICFPLGVRVTVDGERESVTVTDPCLSER